MPMRSPVRVPVTAVRLANRPPAASNRPSMVTRRPGNCGTEYGCGLGVYR